jgi:hypothetical protein
MWMERDQQGGRRKAGVRGKVAKRPRGTDAILRRWRKRNGCGGNVEGDGLRDTLHGSDDVNLLGHDGGGTRGRVGRGAGRTGVGVVRHEHRAQRGEEERSRCEREHGGWCVSKRVWWRERGQRWRTVVLREEGCGGRRRLCVSELTSFNLPA